MARTRATNRYWWSDQHARHSEPWLCGCRFLTFFNQAEQRFLAFTEIGAFGRPVVHLVLILIVYLLPRRSM